MPYAEVAVNAAVNTTFHYHIPDALAGTLQRGHLVRVSFGTAMQPGIVLGRSSALPPELADIQTKPIIELLHPEPVMTPQHLQLGLWMREAYLAAPGACLWLMLPPGITGSSTRQYHLLDPEDRGNTDVQRAILAALREASPQSQAALKPLADTKTLARALKQLESRGTIRAEALLSPPTVAQKMVRTVENCVPPDKIVETVEQTLQRAHKQRKVFAHIAGHDHPLDIATVRDATGATHADLNALAQKGLIAYGERLAYRDSLADRDYVPSQPLQLTAGQQAVWEALRPALNPASPEAARSGASFLLHGVTGSGKTEIYLHAIAEVLQQGRQAIFLVPEIALTPQTIRRVAQRFPGRVAVIHGSLSLRERYDTWYRARQGDVGVIVGTRSALFTPLPDVGLVILDEEHDPSYKHAPPFSPPYYHARAVAEQMMRLNRGVVILGSATPDVETHYRAQRGDITYLHLPSRIMGHRQRIEKQSQRAGVALKYTLAEAEAMTIDLPPVRVVDMRDELKAGNRSMFSRALQGELDSVLARGEQAMLFLNRRGQATYVFCRDCGAVVTCQRCDTPMTYHRYGEDMRCHHCSYTAPAPTTCADCGSARIKYFGAGTQQIEQALVERYPDVRFVRWDADTASQPDQHEAILAQFANGEADVMIGTQMIAKGLDLPLVTLVGVVSADPGLALPDFRADERAFQLLTQVAGRAGRGVLGGQVILQTYQPQHPSIVAAAVHDYAQFYHREIEARRQLGYPPFRRLGRVLVQHTHPLEAQRQAEAVEAALRQNIARYSLTDTHLIGPAPCFFSRLDGHYRWQVLVRSANPRQALESLQVKSGWYVDLDPTDVL